MLTALANPLLAKKGGTRAVNHYCNAQYCDWKGEHNANENTKYNIEDTLNEKISAPARSRGRDGIVLRRRLK